MSGGSPFWRGCRRMPAAARVVGYSIRPREKASAAVLVPAPEIGARMRSMTVSDRRAEALRGLPEAYALGLRLRDAGTPAGVIADRLGIEPESLGPLLALAEAKLATILGTSDLEEP